MDRDLDERIARLVDEEIREHLMAAVLARGPGSPIVRRAVEIAEEVALVAPRERATSPASVTAALGQAVARLDPVDARRAVVRSQGPGLVVASPERLLLLSEIAFRLMLLRAQTSGVEGSIVEEGRWLWLRVTTREIIKGWPPTPTGRAYIALLETLCERIEGLLEVEAGQVEIRLERA